MKNRVKHKFAKVNSLCFQENFTDRICNDSTREMRNLQIDYEIKIKLEKSKERISVISLVAPIRSLRSC